MTVLTLDRVPSGVDPVAVPAVPEQRSTPRAQPGTAALAAPAPSRAPGRRRLDPASIDLRPAGTHSVTLHL